MEVNITKIANEPDLWQYYSASQAEIGPDAGKITWENAMDRAGEDTFLSDEQISAFRDHARECGAWSSEEIESWSKQECGALFLQFVCGDLRERESYIEEGREEEYEKNVGGRVYHHEELGEWYYYLGI